MSVLHLKHTERKDQPKGSIIMQSIYRVYTDYDLLKWRDFTDKAKADEFASRKGTAREEIVR